MGRRASARRRGDLCPPRLSAGVGGHDRRRRRLRGGVGRRGPGKALMASQLVAITGGSGFIGSHVVDALVAAGHRVRVLDTRPPGRADVEWVDVDVMDQDALTDAVRGTAATFHLAAMADVNHIYD